MKASYVLLIAMFKTSYVSDVSEILEFAADLVVIDCLARLSKCNQKGGFNVLEKKTRSFRFDSICE